MAELLLYPNTSQHRVLQQSKRSELQEKGSELCLGRMENTVQSFDPCEYLLSLPHDLPVFQL